ncbi:MAG TPA: nickel-responsive transcriptional regulator NikR [Gemmataceae bacterium]|jgi:CopG family nickel-responsive transcriptional regulator
MAELVRVTVSLEADLSKRFDRFCADGRFATRSEAVRQLIHDRLAREAWASDAAEVTATLTLVYDHHKGGLTQALLDLQHEHADRVVSTMHVHLDHDRCLEVIVLRGPAGELRRFAARLRGLKGIHRGELVVAGAAAAGHGHPHRHR